MKRFSRLLGFIVVLIAVIAAACTVGYAATDGQQLTNLEAGWQRINDSDNHIVYSGNLVSTPDTESYNGDTHIGAGSISFAFTGTKLRIIGRAYISDANKSVIIDGIYKGNLRETSNTTKQSVIFEISGLSNSQHIVGFSGNPLSTGGFQFDAIDIDDTGNMIDINNPNHLTATGQNSEVVLKWDAVMNATGYIVKRSTTPGGPYETLVTTSEITYTDKAVTNGTTYYYVISAVISGKEGTNSNEASATPTAPQPTNQLKLVLEVNEEKQLSVSDELSDNAEMDWASSDSTIATVDANGKLKALNPGNTVITCVSKDKSYTESINVLVVDLDYQLAVDLTAGDTCRLTIDDLKNTTIVKWSSYDPAIATVSAKGKVTAVSEGLTYVVASDKDGKEIGRIYIRVRQ